MRKNPIEITNHIQNEFSEYIASTYTIDDIDYQEQLSNAIASLDLYSGPYLHTSLPFDGNQSINDLIESGLLSKEFRKLKSLDLNRSLYNHQVRSISGIADGRNLVITTGTGSGKTESFLYPILNDIMRSVENGTKGKGVKAIFLYPMNALVNDQKDRIRNILKDYPDITFGSYTGETPTSKKNSYIEDIKLSEGIEIPPNEIISRNEMRDNPPDLLFTNYSMLEYLLIRPKDFHIISPSMMANWKFMILDEAHTYKGTLGIEISLLLKRLVGMVNKNPQFILTSATLGSDKNIDEIIQFATNLTSAKYEEKDIIFSSRKALQKDNIRYTINPNVYVELCNNLDNIDNILKTAEMYTMVEHKNSIENILYDLLIHDSTIYDLYNVIGGTGKYNDIKDRLNHFINISDLQLVSLIQLIALANLNNKFLYDAKFHMFVSAPNRAFVTIGEHKKIKLGNHVTIDGNKAFEIGTCKNCNQPYIIGNIVENRLEPNDSVDVYENYEESMDRILDFFTMKPSDEEDLEEYVVCSKCGHIHLKDNVVAESCECGEEYLVPIYKVDHASSKMKNNISTCVHCGQTNNTGIVKSFYLNKDAATSVLSQIYFEAMGEPIENSITVANPFDLFAEIDNNAKKVEDAKQLLAFSDSRQQASFFSVFFNYNHERFLRRRLIWEELKDEAKIEVKSLAARLTNKIKSENLFDIESSQAQSEAWIAILYDILYVDGQYSSEGMALYNYIYNLKEEMDQIKGAEAAIRQLFNLSVDEFIVLINLTITRLRKYSTVDYSVAELSDQEKKDAFQYINQETFITSKKTPGMSTYESKFIKSFLPTRERDDNLTIDYIMKICKCDKNKALQLAEKLFALMVNLKLFNQRAIEGLNCYQLKADKFIAMPYTSFNWYVCDKCKKITFNNIHNVCPEKGCSGTLVECDPNDLFKNNYYRKQYMNKYIERIITREHTAQLNKSKAREYQKQFKEKNINILSCSTTFEMGVDIGNLENVFLRNVPPTPANYVQRAGRAGRSKDAAALIVTYCGNNSHDFAYFSNPRNMIDGIVNPPLFNVNNEKIVLRHILASAFGFFFRGHEEAFKNMDNFVYSDQMQCFKEYLESHPAKLGKYIDEKVIGESSTLQKYKNFRWVDDVFVENSKLNLFITDMSSKLRQYEEALNHAKDNDDFGLAQYFSGQIERLKRENVISLLSQYAVIPKYGFPVDVVDLNVIGSQGIDKDLNLQRDLSIAISEYAPESEIIVDGEKYVSKYINIPKAGKLERYYYSLCQNCKNTNIKIIPFGDKDVCKHCGSPIDRQEEYFTIPSLGFSTDKNSKKSRTMRPMKTYSGAIKYLGGGQPEEQIFNYKNKIEVRTINNDQLAVVNEHHFFYCPECGYSKIEDGKFSHSITDRYNHKNAFGFPCENKKLERTALGHIFKTDVIRMSLYDSTDYNKMITLTFALIEGLCHELQIERNDVNGLIVQNEFQSYDIILFDNVPGGAGHVKRLVNEATMTRVLEAALEIVSSDCCDEETTCYSCLRNYYNQSFHKIMKRKYAKEKLLELLK